MRRLIITLFVFSIVFSIALSIWQVPGHANSFTGCVMHVASPQYVRLARDAGLQGEAIVQVSIDIDGHVKDCLIISGHPLLGQEAKRSAQLWTFTPGSERVLEIRYRFRLEGRPTDLMDPSDVSFDLPNTVLIKANPKPIDPSR
jgi:TonB family protein